MTKDFVLPFPEGGANSVDPDTTLIAAYIARELSAVQIVELHERIARDPEFRKKVEPLLSAWVLPDSQATVAAAGKSSLTNEEVEAGWRKASASGSASRQSTVDSARSTARQPVDSRSRTLALPARSRATGIRRIAAAVALIVLPVAATAQYIIYAANNTTAPGHSIARAIAPAFLRTELQSDKMLAPRSADYEMQLGDGPVQYQLSAVRGPDQGVPVVEVSASAGHTPLLGSVLGVKELSDGRVMVNDPAWKQLLIFEPGLASAVTALDSSSGSARSYTTPNMPNLMTPLVPWVGDTVLLRDPGSTTQLRVIDGSGSVVRAMDVFMTSATFGGGVDQITTRGASYANPKGQFIYKAVPRAPVMTVPRNAALHAALCSAYGARPDVIHSACSSSSGGGRGGGDGATISIWYNDRADSVPLHRADMDARRIDTVAFLRLPPNSFARTLSNGGGKLVLTHNKDGMVTGVKQVISPLFLVDEFAVLSDGTIGIVRGHDYHVDWIHPDGSRTSSAKLPYDWKPLTDADKQKLVDSVRSAVDSVDAVALWGATNFNPLEFSFVMANGGRGRGEAFLDSIKKANNGVLPEEVWRQFTRTQGGTGGGAGAVLRSGSRAAQPSAPAGPVREIPQPRGVPYEIVPLSAIPDYHPPIGINSVMPDHDGNLWILPRTTSQSKQGELVYDVVNPKRGLVKRVRLPLGRSIAGFGRGGVVFLQVGEVARGFVLEKVVVK